MADQISFKKRVLLALIANAHSYKYYFVDYEYLLCSDAFKGREYYIASGREDNYLHLTGVKTALSARQFFAKCFDGTLSEDDFSIGEGSGSNSIKGSIRRKISVFPNIPGIFSSAPLVEEDFHKNRVYCTFAAGMTSCTLGFISAPKAYPETLLKGNLITDGAALDLVLRRKSGSDKFGVLVAGGNDYIERHFDAISGIITSKMIERVLALYYEQFKDRDAISEKERQKIEKVYAAYQQAGGDKAGDEMYKALCEKYSSKESDDKK